MIRWGILGAGNIAHRFAKSLQYEEDSVLYAISGRSAKKLEAFAAQFPCEKQYTGHELLLEDENVDAVYLALPHAMHYEWAVKALRRHIPVLCEKPACINEEQTRLLAACAKENDTLLMEAMKTRFVPAYLEMKKLLEEGKIGEIKMISASQCFVIPAEAFGRSYHTLPEGGGALLDAGVYCAGVIEDLFKGEPEFVKTYANYINGVDFYTDAFMKFGGGTAELECGFDRNAPKNAVITGTGGTITIPDFHRPQTIILEDENGKTEIAKPYDHDDFYSQIHHFTQLVSQGVKESPVMPYDAMIREAHILERIREQFTKYDGNDLMALEAQEKELSMSSFANEDALYLGNTIVSLAREYDRPVAVRIDRCEDDLTVFQYVMDGKTEANLRYMDGKKKCVLDSGHSSAWIYVSTMIDSTYDSWKNDGIHLISGGAFPLYADGEMKAVIQVSGLHEGKDHELIVRALSEMQDGKPYTDFIKGIG